MKHLNLIIFFLLLTAGVCGQSQDRAPTALEQYEKPYKEIQAYSQQVYNAKSTWRANWPPKFHNVKIPVAKSDFDNTHFTDSIFNTVGQYVLKAKARDCDLIHMRIRTPGLFGKIKSMFFDVNVLLQQAEAAQNK